MVPFEVVATATAVALLLLLMTPEPPLGLVDEVVPLTLLPMPLLELELELELLLLELLDEVPHSGAGDEVALLFMLLPLFIGPGLPAGFGDVSIPFRLARLDARAEIRRLRSSRRSDLSGDTWKWEVMSWVVFLFCSSGRHVVDITSPKRQIKKSLKKKLEFSAAVL